MRFTCAVLSAILLPAVGFGTDTRVAEAAMHEDQGALQSLLGQKADLNGALPDGATALHWAVNTDDLQTVDLLIHQIKASPGDARVARKGDPGTS